MQHEADPGAVCSGANAEGLQKGGGGRGLSFRPGPVRPCATAKPSSPPPRDLLEQGGEEGGRGVQGGAPPPPPEHTQSTGNRKIIGE